MPPCKAVIFDLGGVLVPSPMEFWAKELEPSLGLASGSIQACLLSAPSLALFHQLEIGQLSLEDFEPLFGHFYNQKNGTSLATPIPLFSKHLEWATPDPRWRQFLQSVRAEGIRTALLTNNFFLERAKRAETLPGIDRSMFDVLIESCKIGIRKPDPIIFQRTLAKLEVAPEEAIFVDDLGTNLKSARQMGLRTVKCSDSAECIAELAKLLGLDLDEGYTPPGSRMPTKAEQLQLGPLAEYFHTKFGNPSGKLMVRKFAYGQSNPTYFVRLGNGQELVLRKKPAGKLLPSAHLIEREFRVQKALEGHVPVPRMLEFEENVLPEPFYLMAFCRGRIFHDPELPELEPKERRQIWLEACRVLAKIHAVDQVRVGLADFGKEGGYFERNLARMEAEMGGGEEDRGGLMGRRVLHWLRANCPGGEGHQSPPGIVHGDFRLDNLVFCQERPELEAVLDWELSTLGHPLADLANLLLPFCLSPSQSASAFSPLKYVRPTAQNGIPSIRELLLAYLEGRRQMGRPEPMANALLAPNSHLLTFGLVYAIFRNSIILAGVFRRFLQGQASNAAMARELADLPERLVNQAWALIGRCDGGEGRGVGVPLTPEMMRSGAYCLYEDVKQFIDQEIVPREGEMFKWGEDEKTRWKVCPILEELKEKARAKGLWNLFITEQLDPKGRFGGRGLNTTEYAHICELMARSAFGPEVCNCSAPDTGNMEVLMKYGDGRQREEFLAPLLEGRTRSCFAMTEPDVASSDATNIQGSIVRDVDGCHLLLNARKWFTSGAAHPQCRLCLFMGRILPPSGGKQPPFHRRQSILLVPMPSPGLFIVRNLSVLGNFDPPGGHCEVLFQNVRVPCENLILGEGRGFEIAQGRLGPGRIHHCMRLIGYGERAMELVRERIAWRRLGREGTLLAEKQAVRLDLAQSRIELEQARLLVLKAAHLIDVKGPKAAAAEISMIKVVAPNAVQRILDRAIQTFGAAGLTTDWPLALFSVWARSLRMADGPDIVHLETVAKRELAKL